MTEICEIHIIELPKLEELVKKDKLSEEEKELKKWAKFLLTPEELEVTDMENDESIKKAKEEFDALKQDGKEKYLAELRMKYVLDTNNIKATGYRIGREERTKEIAREMLKNGIDIETIVKCTGLTKEDIEKIS